MKSTIIEDKYLKLIRLLPAEIIQEYLKGVAVTMRHFQQALLPRKG